LLWAIKVTVHEQAERRALQPIGVRPAEQLSVRARTLTTHPGVSFFFEPAYFQQHSATALAH
jgi:hypothetical protein